MILIWTLLEEEWEQGEHAGDDDYMRFKIFLAKLKKIKKNVSPVVMSFKTRQLHPPQIRTSHIKKPKKKRKKKKKNEIGVRGIYIYIYIYMSCIHILLITFLNESEIFFTHS